MTYLVALGSGAGSDDTKFSEGVVKTTAEEVEVGGGSDCEGDVQVAIVADEDILWLAISVQISPLGRGSVSSRHVSASTSLGDGEISVSAVGILAGASSGASIAALDTVKEVDFTPGRVKVGATTPVQTTGVVVDVVARAQSNAVRRDWSLNLSLAGSNTIVPNLRHLGVTRVSGMNNIHVGATTVGINVSRLVQSVVHVHQLDLPGGAGTLSLLDKTSDELVVLNNTAIV